MAVGGVNSSGSVPDTSGSCDIDDIQSENPDPPSGGDGVDAAPPQEPGLISETNPLEILVGGGGIIYGGIELAGAEGLADIAKGLITEVIGSATLIDGYGSSGGTPVDPNSTGGVDALGNQTGGQ